ncbi:MAG TPA: dolichyl-phosphate beta-glucosyltransferase [Planctomycetota bacterium]|jgi:dolichyl-phosphate beta-glucosyltransferase
MVPSLSVIVPAYNEAARLGQSLRTILQYLQTCDAETELIVVDDGSTDGTPAVAEEAFAHAAGVSTRLIWYHPNRGKGHAVRTGLLSARAPVALFSDADLSTPIDEAPALLELLAQDQCDIAFGSRALESSLIGLRQPWGRELGGRIFNRIVRLATGLDALDTQCGFKAFRMSTCRPVIESARLERFAFDVELLYLAHMAGLRIRECPVQWDHCEGSKISFMRDSMRMFQEVISLRRRVRKGAYRPAIEQARRKAVSVRLRGARGQSSIRRLAKAAY